MQLNFGVIGCGGIADAKVIPAIVKTKGVYLKAVMDINESRAKKIAKKYKANKWYNSIEKLLRDNIDAVYISTPNHLHASQTMLAAKSGKHVLCEKPMAINVRECKNMIEACKKNRVKLMIGYMARFHACNEKARKFINGGLIGDPVMAKSTFSGFFPPEMGGWRLDRKLSGGGPIMDLGIYCFGMIRFLLGKDVKKVSAFVNNISFNYSVEDCAMIMLELEGGVPIIVDTAFNRAGGGESSFEIYGSKGSLYGRMTFHPQPTGELKSVIQGHKKTYSVKIEDQYEKEIQHFVECIIQDRIPVVDGNFGMKDIQIAMASYKASRTGDVVTF